MIFILFIFSFFFTLTFFSHIYDFEYAMVCLSDFLISIERFIPPAAGMAVSWPLSAVSSCLNCLSSCSISPKVMCFSWGNSHTRSNQQWDIQPQSPYSKTFEGLPQLQNSLHCQLHHFCNRIIAPFLPLPSPTTTFSHPTVVDPKSTHHKTPAWYSISGLPSGETHTATCGCWFPHI